MINLQPIRLNWHYVLWYRNVTVLFLSLVIPLILLAYWNFNTLSVILRRQRLRNRPSICSDLPLNARDGLMNVEAANNSYDSTVGSVIQELNAGSLAPASRRGSRSDQSNISFSSKLILVPIYCKLFVYVHSLYQIS